MKENFIILRYLKDIGKYFALKYISAFRNIFYVLLLIPKFIIYFYRLWQTEEECNGNSLARTLAVI